MLRRIGLYFGSFNPVHKGHVFLAEYLLEHHFFEEIWFVLSPQNPFKKRCILLDDALRLAMLKLALKDASCKIKVSEVELNLPIPSYTVDTLAFLRKEHPEIDFQLIIGGDNVSTFNLWKDYKEILSLHKVIVYPRKGCVTNINVYENMQEVLAPFFEVSSTQIRELIEIGGDYSSYLSVAVRQFILDNKLYTSGE